MLQSWRRETRSTLELSRWTQDSISDRYGMARATPRSLSIMYNAVVLRDVGGGEGRWGNDTEAWIVFGRKSRHGFKGECGENSMKERGGSEGEWPGQSEDDGVWSLEPSSKLFNRSAVWLGGLSHRVLSQCLKGSQQNTTNWATQMSEMYCLTVLEMDLR